MNRCSVCDWNPMGMCANYEIDKYLSKGKPNKVLWDNDKQVFICLKCFNAIQHVKYEHVIADEKEEKEEDLLKDFTDEEIQKIEKQHPWNSRFKDGYKQLEKPKE